MILDLAATYFGVSVNELTGRNRSAKIALQRQIVMHIIREETGASLPQIGAILGGRDHTTIIHGCDRVAGDIERDGEIARQVAELRARLYEPMRVR
jgi:chromosomal replication initiator protein